MNTYTNNIKILINKYKQLSTNSHMMGLNTWMYVLMMLHQEKKKGIKQHKIHANNCWRVKTLAKILPNYLIDSILAIWYLFAIQIVENLINEYEQYFLNF